MSHIIKTNAFKQGIAGEEVVIDFILKNSKEYSFVRKNDNSNFDFILEKNGEHKTYEVKTDSSIYPNFFIEFESRNKKSSISVTTADWFCYYFSKKKQLYFIKTEDLRHLIFSNKFEVKTITEKNDTDSTKSMNKGFIIPVEEFKRFFKKYELS